MNLLEEEVYAVHSPIWDLHFKDSDLKKIILTGKKISFFYDYIFNYVLIIDLIDYLDTLDSLDSGLDETKEADHKDRRKKDKHPNEYV